MAAGDGCFTDQWSPREPHQIASRIRLTLRLTLSAAEELRSRFWRRRTLSRRPSS